MLKLIRYYFITLSCISFLVTFNTCKADEDLTGNNLPKPILSSPTASCGALAVHNSNKIYGNLTDQEGNEYKTIVIGSQVWMAENLKTSIYRNGEPIPHVTNNDQWADLNTGAWCYYNNNSQLECPYGKLYNWFAVSDPRNLCPIGWHVPTNAEWNELTDYLGGEVVGGKMKSAGTQYWSGPNTDATNWSGFSGLPGGLRFHFGTFDFMSDYGYWWSSTQNGTNSVLIRHLGSPSGHVYQDQGSMPTGFSVRCVKD
jgi:uncharacterized protein (TIGR02145 family)